MPNFFDKKIKQLDMYGQPILFTYRNSILFTSTCGVVVSLIVIILILIYGILLILDIMAYDKPKLLKLTQTNGDAEMLSYMIPDFSGYFNSNFTQLEIPTENSANTVILQVSVGLEDNNSHKFVPLDPKYFYISFNDYQKVVTPKTTTVTENPLYFDYCKRFPYANNSTFSTYLMNRSLCLYSPFILKGESASSDYRKLNINLNFCKNDTLGYYNKILSNEYKRLNFLAKRWVEKNNKNFTQYYLSLDKLTAIDLINYPPPVETTIANTTTPKGEIGVKNNIATNNTSVNCTSGNGTLCNGNSTNSTAGNSTQGGNSTLGNNTLGNNTKANNTGGNTTTGDSTDDTNNDQENNASSNNTQSSTNTNSTTNQNTTQPDTKNSTTNGTSSNAPNTTNSNQNVDNTATTSEPDPAERINSKKKAITGIKDLFEKESELFINRHLQTNFQINTEPPKNTTPPVVQVQPKISADDLLFMSISPHVDLLSKFVNISNVYATSTSNLINQTSITNSNIINPDSTNTNSTTQTNSITNNSTLNSASNSATTSATPSTLFLSKVVCAPQNEIINKIKSTRLVFFFTTTEFNSTNLKTPISTRANYVYLYPSHTLKKTVDTFFSMDRATTYSSIIPASMLPFNQDNKNYIPNFSVDVVNTAYSDVDASQPFFIIDIKYSRTRIDFQRNYRDIFDIMGLVGGISKIVMLLGFFVVFYVVNLKLKESLINEFYSVIDPDNLVEVNKDFETFLKEKSENFEKNDKYNNDESPNKLDLFFSEDLVLELSNYDKNSKVFKKYEIVYEVFKHQVHSNLTYTFTEIMANMLCVCCLTKRMKIKNITFRKAWNKLIDDTDFITILKSVQEFKNLKQVLLDEAQHDLFSSLKNEEIKKDSKTNQGEVKEEFLLKKSTTIKGMIDKDLEPYNSLKENLEKISQVNRRMDDFDLKLMKNLVDRKKIILEFLGDKNPRKDSLKFDEEQQQENCEEKKVESMKNEDFKKITNLFYKSKQC
jgi:hypothetical protein